MDQAAIGLGRLQVAILAGGVGERLRPLTDTVPKPMVPVRGRPFLEHQLELLRRHGARRVLLLVSHLGQQIERHFGDGRGLGLAITYAYEPSPLGTAGALRLAAARLDDAFVLVNGDTYLETDYAAFVARFEGAGRLGLMAVYRNPGEHLAANNVSVMAGGVVSRYEKGKTAGLTHADAGLYALRKSVVIDLKAGRSASLERDVFPCLARLGELMAFEAGRYYDIGTFERLELVERELP